MRITYISSRQLFRVNQQLSFEATRRRDSD